MFYVFWKVNVLKLKLHELDVINRFFLTSELICTLNMVFGAWIYQELHIISGFKTNLRFWVCHDIV